MLSKLLEKLVSQTAQPCVTISLNTHRTHPDNVQDGIVMKNLCKEAENRLLQEFDKRSIAQLLDNLHHIQHEIDINHNLESLHLFVSNEVKEYARTIWHTPEEKVQISNTFAIRPIVKALNRTEEHFILVLSQSGVHLYKAVNDTITEEIHNHDFPVKENTHYHTDKAKGSDPKKTDDMVREFLNRVDKAVNSTVLDTGLKVIAVCTEDNHSRLMQVADRPQLYYPSYIPINYNDTTKHKLAADAWHFIQPLQQQRRTEAIEEMLEAVSQAKVLTELNEIYRAAVEGRGELLIVHDSFAQPVVMTGDDSFDIVDDATMPGAIDDITSNIAWEIISKKGRVVFTEQDAIKELGKIALKIRW